MMEKTYNPRAIEQASYEFWESQGLFTPAGDGEAYCIMLPPPNVTGSLHMGHGFQHSLMDTLIRYHRMCGRKTLWQAGTDHAGISTQMVVERQLAAEGVSRHDLGRENFIQRIWRWKLESGGNITRQMRRMGTSVDWSREKFTLDEDLNKAVLEVFVRLYEEGLIYRDKRLVNWDPAFCSAISDLEVINTEEDGNLWHIRYPLSEGDGFLVVATTRPETLLGDAAVAVHPEDARYQSLIGKSVKLPLTDRLIPVIADDYVDPGFGSGCVKITPAHDFNDFEVGKRHHLPLINIFTETAHLNTEVPEAYQGMERFAAREKIIADLQTLHLIEKIEAHKLSVPRADRGNTIIEPYLTNQWFVRMESLAQPAIDAVKSGKIRFVPENWEKTYYQWLENIEDWCISRQLWWGHRIPAWYDEAGTIYVGRHEQEVREKYQLTPGLPLRQDEDVLDTWFSSALWPFATLGWPEQTPELTEFYPTDVLVTGFDIIFFWVARMIMMGLKFTGKVPFKDVYFTALIRDGEGQKMSKSKGNVLDPIDLIDGIDLETLVQKRTYGLMQPWMAKKIEKMTRKEFPEGIPAFGGDALRFTFCALATTGRDVRFDLNRLEGYRNFCNKIWNAARYVIMNVENQALDATDMELSLADQWIQAQLQLTIDQVHEHLQHYRFDLTAQALYEFIWHEFCDWYLELSKPVLSETDVSAARQAGTRRTLIDTLETILRLLHPLMPFITEEIWQQIKPYTRKTGKSLMLEPYPKAKQTASADAASSIEAINWLKNIIIKVRNIRGENSIAPNKTIKLFIKKADTKNKNLFDRSLDYLIKLCRIQSIDFLAETETVPLSATTFVDDMEIHVPLAGLIDIDAESRRLNKEIEKLQKDLEKSQQKLANPAFVDKAPQAVVQQEKTRLREAEDALKKLQGKLRQLSAAVA